MSRERIDDAAGEAEPFVETRAGGLFFLNAVLAGPALLIIWPVIVRGVLRGVGAVNGPSPLLDPVPAVAGQLGPYVGWLSAFPLVTTILNLRLPLPSAARWTLRAFAAVHVGVLAWWALEVFG